MPETGSTLPVPPDARGEDAIVRAILDFVARVPPSTTPDAADPAHAAGRLTLNAARHAGLTAGSLALPPGPLGWLTLVPELVAIWRIQAQLVSDIAAAHGRHAALGREAMLWCLFRHTAAQAFRDLAVRMGDRLVFRPASAAALERIARHVGIVLAGRTAGRGLARWLPLAGALGVGAYAYHDTRAVGRTTLALMQAPPDAPAPAP